MALPTSGPLTLANIQTEFGGANPIGLNEYYAGGAYVAAGTSGTYGAVPSSGAISIRNFYGTAAYVPIYPTAVFQTSLYTGNGGTQTITNNVNLDFGGLVWITRRAVASGRVMGSPTFGTDNFVFSDKNEGINNVGSSYVSYNSDGFTVGSGSVVNRNGDSTVAWTFREKSKFFDVVTWTGNATNRTISHALGSTPNCIMVKRTDTTGDWQVYNGSLANTEYLVLNSTAAKATGATRWNSTTPTSTVFSVGTDATVNASGGTYVAFLFANLAGGFGATGTDNAVASGGYSGTGSAQTINCGFTAGCRFLMIKRASSTGDWYVWDTSRGIISGNDPYLLVNTSTAETTGTDYISPQSVGFGLTSSAPAEINQNGGSFIYIAIA
jgi:hypothetical protein